MDLPELVKATVKHLIRPTLFYGAFRYRVLEQIGDLVSLQAVATVEGLPDQIMLPKCHGLGGTTEQLVPSTLVLVEFEGGDPAAPFVAHYMPGQPVPLSTTLKSSDKFSVFSGDFNVDAKNTANIIAEEAVYLGGGEMQPAAVGTLVDDRLVTLLNAVNAALGALAIPPIAPLGSVQSNKVYVTTGEGKPVDPHAP